MKCIFILLFAVRVAIAQIGASSITGTVVDAKTLRPVPLALVIAVQSGPTPASKKAKTGGDGAYQIQGLPAGTYSLCVQAGDGYLDPCHWNGTPTIITLAAGRSATGFLKLTSASILTIQVQDAQQILNQNTRDGRHPELTLGVWGPKGLYYPARLVAGSAIASGPQALKSYSYQVAVPRDTALKFYVASRDLKLGDAGGLALPGNASQQAFQHTTGDVNPKSFAFSVLGLLP